MRAHLHHMAFIILNKLTVIDVFYKEEEIKRFKGYRVLVIDGSISTT